MTSRASARTITIGAVLRELRPDFPDVTISKIRFLEAEGLITPERTPSGYRTFTRTDVDRLRYILTAQRDRFWPLKVIRDALDALGRGLAPAEGDSDSARPQPPAATPDPEVPTTAELTRRSDVRLTRDELISSAGLEAATFEALASFGLLVADTGGYFDRDALSVAHAAGALAAYGLEPRHLRSFKTAADREIGLVQQALSPVRGRRSSTPVADPAPEILRHCIALHTALVRVGLRASR